MDIVAAILLIGLLVSLSIIVAQPFKSVFQLTRDFGAELKRRELELLKFQEAFRLMDYEERMNALMIMYSVIQNREREYLAEVAEALQALEQPEVYND